MDNELQKLPDQTPVIEKQVQRITDFLNEMGLPSDNIIAPLDQREKIGKNLPDLIYNLPAEVKTGARYLSKVVVGAGFGLFDYALNSIWNEVVLALRKIAITYGLDIFFDKAVGAASRGNFKDEDDLGMLKDIVLLDTCKKLELISESTYKKLAHILDMRNDIGISHPTNANINAFELMGWVETCIKEVLQDQPSPDAIQVKSLITNFKEYADLVDQAWIDQVTPKLKALPTHHCDSIIRTLFGVYVSKETGPTLAKNISVLAPVVWPLTSTDEKDRLGFILAGYNNNLHKDKHTKGIEFFGFVKGNNHRTINERTVALDNLASRLKNAHFGWDNFMNEPPIIEEIMTFIEKPDDIPQQVVHNLVKTITLCRIGRGIPYNNGVSQRAKPYYNMFMKIIGPRYADLVMFELTQPDAQRKLQKSSIALTACKEMLTHLHSTVINGRQKEGLEYLIANIEKSASTVYSKQFQQISAPFITWS
ncbi:hypothetical protein EGT74_06350 [Chitinophaga lutea]|uniref:Uncharacterized protein n=1 Tax=Chitinophaga lutea TaxID=2488634 RepID=A0A3N4PYW5_9BACT|nr:hypothetical protein [Chitinophaga lutea]RPE13148.1 hypothetical protein EGT74_06350 [Chitinophaga lutea]